MKKHSFSLSSKPSSKPNLQKRSQSFIQDDQSIDEEKTHQEFVTEFVPSETPSKKPSSKHVIPRLENTWNPYKKMRNIDLPIGSSSSQDNTDGLRFEAEAPSTITDTDANMSYGLNLRVNGKENGGDGDVSDRSEEPPNGSIESLMLQKFKDDLRSLPDEQSFDEFSDVPIEGFGAALMGAYGWSEGKGIGRNAKEDVKVVQYVRRGGREGLGFEPEMRDKEEKKGRRQELVAQRGSDGRTRHVVGIDEKLVPRELRGIHVGKTVRIVGGRHVGLKSKVLEKLGGGESEEESHYRVVLKLLRSGEEVTVRVDEVAELGSVEEERCLKKLQQLKIEESKDDERRSSSSRNDRDRRKDSGRDDKRKKEERRNREEAGRSEKGRHEAHQSSSRNGGSKEEENNSRSWLTSNIRVRIISKDFKGGRLYLKKGAVVDVVGPKICDVSMDDSKELIQGVHEDILETALPRRGGPILVLYGKHKGVYGNLMERDMERETGVVRDADSHELIDVRLEQVAEYIGDPSYIGY